MVAVFTGLGAGFQRSSATGLSGGLLGSGLQGRGGVNVSVNAATGNLVVTSRQDEFLIGRGPDAGVHRTYNSLHGGDDNGDHWRQSTNRRMRGLTGTANTNGSTVVRVSGDGSEITYTYHSTYKGMDRNGNIVTGSYRSTDGGGAHDSIVYGGGKWTWNDGNSGIREIYYGSGSYLREVIDRDGNQVTYTYNSSNKLYRVSTQNGGYIQYNWSGNRIESVTNSSDGGTTDYQYDGSGRLNKVVSDGYWVAYTYHGSSKRIASITQKDGSRIDFTYTTGDRVYDVIQHPGNGEPVRTTKFRYASDGSYTDVYDPSGVRSILYHDGKEQLTRARIYAPDQGIDYSSYYTYDGSGNVLTAKDAEGNTTTYTYDSRGNVATVTDAQNRVKTNSYNSRNQLIRSYYYASTEGNAGTEWILEHFIYDAAGHLRYTIDGDQNVTEFEYDSAGQLRFTKKYPDVEYGRVWSIPTVAAMDGWVAGLSGAQKQNTIIRENRYDALGNLKETVAWSTANTSAGVTGGDGYTHTVYTHDAQGRVLTSTVAGLSTQTYAYDAMGRMTSHTDLNGGTTTYSFNDAATQTTITSANGLVTLKVFNKAGDLISETNSGKRVTTGTVKYEYDKNGRVRVRKEVSGGHTSNSNAWYTYYVYDKAGNLTAEVDHYGFVQEFRYDKNGRQVAHARYTRYKATADRNAMLATLKDPNNTLQAKDLKYSADPAANHHGYDIWQWTAYDSRGQVARTVMGDGSVMAYTYDTAGQLVQTRAYANKLSSAQLVNLRAGTVEADAYLPAASSSKDQITRTFYNRGGQVAGTLDGNGYLTQYKYDKAGRKIQESIFGNKATNLTGTFNQVYASVAKSSAKDAHTRFVYDGQFLRYTIDARSKVTELIYRAGGYNTATGVVRSTIQHHDSLGSLSNYTLATVKSAVNALGNKSLNRTSWNVYDTRNRLAYTIDPAGSVTKMGYNSDGTVSRTTQYSVSRTTTSLPSIGTMNSFHNANWSTARITSLYYNAAGQVDYAIDPEGYVTSYTYDRAGRKLSESSWSRKFAFWQTDTEGEVLAASKGTEVKTQYSYDARGFLSSVYNADNTRHLYTYYANHELAWDIRAYGHGTEEESRVLHVNDAAGRRSYSREYTGSYSNTSDPDYRKYRQTMFYYDGRGNLTRQREYQGNHTDGGVERSTYFEYDKGGNLVSQKDGENKTTRFEHNAFGQVTKVIDARGHATTNIYNQAGQLTETRDAYNKADKFTYDAFGQVARSTNKLGGYTDYTYDKLGRVIQERVRADVYNSAGSKLSSYIYNKFEYDAFGNQTKIIEAHGRTEQRTTTFEYDLLGRVEKKMGDAVSVYTDGTDSSAQTVTPTETFKYDSRGNLIESKDANGARTLYYYDNLNRVTHQISPEGTLVRNFYDRRSNLKETRIYSVKVGLPSAAGGTPPAGSGAYRRTTFKYDGLDRMTDSYVHAVQTAEFNGSTLSISARSNILHTRYAYDANGNLIRVTDPNGNVTTSTYDRNNRKTSSTDAAGFKTDWVYDANGNVTRETRHGHGTGANRVTNYTYDNVNRRTAETRVGVQRHNGSGGHTTQDSTIRYQYNALGQVTRKTEATGDYIAYTYDSQGRMNYETRSGYTDHLDGSVSPKVQYLYNGLNDVSRVYKYGKTGSISHTDSHYTYAKGGRLTSVQDAENKVRTYRYDAKGQLVREEYERTSSLGVKTTEGIGYTFDKEGRVTAQGSVWKNGSTWTRSGLDVVQSKYNTFGDVVERGVNGKYSEKMAYDNAGRLWRTNSGDGAYKYFMYDANGNQSLVLTSTGANIDNKSIGQVIAEWGVSVDGANANRIVTDYENDVVATITRYDNRNLAIEVREPERQVKLTGSRYDLTTKRSYNAFGEVTSETDANNKTINYTYNTMGRRIKVESPLVSVTSHTGAVSNARPTEHYYYDISGRLVASKDANGNLTRQTLLAGTGYGGSQALITETHAADGGKVKTAYDIHGNARKITDQLNRVTTNTFDRLGRLTKVQHANGLVSEYAYDELGQKIKEWNNQLVITTNTDPYSPPTSTTDYQRTDYDAQGRVTGVRAFGGDVMAYSYAWNTSSANGLSEHGGWIKTTTYHAANNRTSKEFEDVFGRTKKTTDMGGRDTLYTYDKGGRMVSASGLGTDTQNYTYLNTGRVGKLIVSGTGYTGNVYNASNVSRTSTYGYDKVGNLTLEQLIETATATHYGPYGEVVSQTTTNKTLQNSVATYDALGRLTRWEEKGVAAQSGYGTTVPRAYKNFEYDKQGNIRRTVSSALSMNGSGGVTRSSVDKDSWFLYDSMNRITRSEGTKVGSTITRGTGTDIAYDKAGQRIYTVQDVVTYTAGDPYAPPIPVTTTTRENYSYNAAGQLTQVREAKTTNGTLPGTGGTIRSTMTYDLLGRQTRQLDRDAAGSTNYVVDIAKTYNNKSQIATDTTIIRRSGSTYKTVTSYNYGSGSTYAMGAAYTVTASSYKNNSFQSRALTTNTYAWYSGAVVNSTTYDADTSSSSNQIGSTSYQYSKNGTLIGSNIRDGRSRSVTFTVDNNGQTIRRVEKDNKTGGDPHEIWYRFGGKEMGYVGNNGTLNQNYNASISDRATTPTTGTNAGAFRHGRTTGASHTDFDQAYNAVNSYSQGSQGGTYTVQGGETLQSIAQSTYGDSALWYKIAQVNGMDGSTPLIAGQTLVMPVGVVKSAHNAGTVKPYSPGETQGDLNPTTPYPQTGGKKGKKCGVLGAILLVVVAVAVTLATAGAAAAALTPGLSLGSGISAAFSAGGLAAATTAAGATIGTGTVIAAGVIGAAAGSIASQAVGVATGIQEKFSWKNVAISALSAGITAGLGDKALNAFGSVKSSALQAGLRAAAGSAITQGISVATGLQPKFSWAGVAASGVGAAAAVGATGVANKFGRSLGRGMSGGSIEAYLRISKTASKAFASVAASVANAATRSAIEGSSFGDNIIASIPDVIGNALVNFASACFTSDTEVHTPDGLKRIDQIKVGDWVCSRDERFEDSTIHKNRVNEVYRYEDRATMSLMISYENGGEVLIQTTPEHPFAVMKDVTAESPKVVERAASEILTKQIVAASTSYAWCPAGDLHIGDKTIDINGRVGLVTEISADATLGTVHNFSVEGDHTYFVGASGVWVHNDYRQFLDKLMRALGHPPRMQFEDSYNDRYGPGSYNSLTLWEQHASSYTDAQKGQIFGFMESFGATYEQFDELKNATTAWIADKYSDAVDYVAEGATISQVLSFGAEFAEDRGWDRIAEGFRQADGVVEGIIRGVGGGIGGIAGGLGQMVLNPIDTVIGIWDLGAAGYEYSQALRRGDRNAAADLAFLKDAYVQSWKDGYGAAVASGGSAAGTEYVSERASKLLTEVGSLFLGGAGAWSKLRHAGKTSSVARWALSLQQQRALARLTHQVRNEFVNDFAMMERYMTPGQIRGSRNGMLPANFGHAVENRVTELMLRQRRQDPNGIWKGFSTREDLGLPNNNPWDFRGTYPDGSSMTFDITSGTSSSIRKHYARDSLDTVVAYDPLPRSTVQDYLRWAQ